jgi:hypothetical protein
MRHRMGPPFSPWIHVGPPIDLKTEQGFRWNDAVPEAGAPIRGYALASADTSASNTDAALNFVGEQRQDDLPLGERGAFP